MPKRSKKYNKQFNKIRYRFSNHSIFFQYFFVFVSIILICFIVLGTILYYFLSSYWQKQKKQNLVSNATRVANISTMALSDNIAFEENKKDSNDKNQNNGTRTEQSGDANLRLISSNLALISEATNTDVFITNTDGKVVLCKEMVARDYRVKTYHCAEHDDYNIDINVIPAASKDGFYAVMKIGGKYKHKQLVAAEPIIVNGKTVAVVFAVAPNLYDDGTFLKTVLKMFVLASILSFLIGFVIINAFSRKSIGILNQMSRASKSYAKGDFTQRVEISGHNELSILAENFNSMANALELIEKSRASFIANVSHELKTPMTTIGGFIDGILDGTIEKKDQSHYLNIVSDETRRLARLVTAMLNISKMEAGEINLNPVNFDISAEILNVMLSFERKINSKNIEVKGLDIIKPTKVNADRDMIHEVIYNLIDNAVKFTENGSLIVGVNKERGYVSVSIRNTGAGISKEECAMIFDRFYKVDKSRSYDKKGAGIGLFICKTMIDMHGGKIECNSEQGRYTEFTFTIPDIY